MQKNNKTISIPLFLVVIIFAILIIVGVKTICFGNNENISNQEIAEKDNDTTIENSEETVLLTKIEGTQEEETVQDKAKQEENSTEDIKQENTNNKIKTYITSNGQKYDSIGIVNIPRLGIEYPILATTSEKTLKVSVTKYWGGNPNEVGNLCITGHNYKNSKFFGKLLSIKQGDIIKITDLSGRTLDYTVYDTYVVDPKDTTCTSQLTDGKVEVTLITCYYENGNAHATKRFIVKARVK